MEYLCGSTYFNDRGQRDFKDFCGHNVKEEKKAFTSFIDWAFERWRKDPSMHIYHYGSYEITALRRLMGNYGIREYEVDKLLRNEVFVDLYNIIRHGVLIGEPSYSIKNVEHIYREKRNTEVSSGGESILVYEEWRANPRAQCRSASGATIRWAWPGPRRRATRATRSCTSTGPWATPL